MTVRRATGYVASDGTFNEDRLQAELYEATLWLRRALIQHAKDEWQAPGSTTVDTIIERMHIFIRQNRETVARYLAALPPEPAHAPLDTTSEQNPKRPPRRRGQGDRSARAVEQVQTGQGAPGQRTDGHSGHMEGTGLDTEVHRQGPDVSSEDDLASDDPTA